MSVFTCPNCSGGITFDPELQSMKCPYCDSEVTIDDYRAALAAHNKMLVNEQSCPQCGGTLLTTDTTVATFCSYCGSSVTLQSRLTETERPTAIVPFKISKRQAINRYKEKVHTTLLAPDWMTDENNTGKFRGIYMPFHIFSFKHQGTWEGEVSDYHLEHSGGKDYDVTRYYDIGAETVVNYNFIPVDAASGFPDGISRAVCPYRREKETDFEEAYYAGFYADRADVAPELYVDKYETAVMQDVASHGSINCGHVSVPASKITKNMKLEASSRASMFPVWFLTFRNKDKVNYACVNGDTGEVAVDIPIDFRKYLVATVIVAAIFSVLLNLAFTIKPSELLCIVAILALIALIIGNNLLNATYRRIKHYDDAGYLGEDKDRVIKRRRARVFAGGCARIIGGCIAFFLAVMVAAIMDVDEELLGGLVAITVMAAPVIIIITAVRSARNSGSGYAIRRKDAPIWYKALVLAKPLVAIIACLVVLLGWGEVNGAMTQLMYSDELCYGVAMAGIALIIWSAFDVVRLHNRFTMRDLPIFTEARGGDE